MKKNLMFAALLLISGAVTAQEQKHEFEITQEPEFIESACENSIFMDGVSENGRYCWGSTRYEGYYCDLETGEYALVGASHEQKYEQGYTQSKIAAVTNDGIAIVNLGHKECYLLNIATGEKTYLQSPMEDYPYVYVWDISNDGSVIGGNFINEGNAQYPMYGKRQADGTYKLTPLEFDKFDAVGDSAQFTQVRRVMSSGKYIAGSQIDASGSVARFVVWKLDEDGNYKYTTPIDRILYDTSVENPGPQPVFEDYVTAEDMHSDEYKQQQKDFYKILYEWYDNFALFTKNCTTVDWGGIQRSTRDNWICSSVNVATSEYSSSYYPMYYDCDNDNIVMLEDNFKEENRGIAMLGEGKYLTMCGNRWTKLMITDDGVTKPFHEWLKDKTGMDVSETYHFEYTDHNTGMPVDDILMGMPTMSYDGKTLVLTTFDHGGYKASVIRFNKSIFGDVETGISANVVNNFDIAGTEIDGNADVDVYTLDGKMVKSVQVSGHTDLKDILSSGSYVVKVRSDKNVVRSFKLFVL